MKYMFPKRTFHLYNRFHFFRAIFRWITVKDLNVLKFEAETTEDDDDSPMGILQGIKLGTETYHTLFMRLCA